jgi:hypothetical protein
MLDKIEEGYKDQNIYSDTPAVQGRKQVHYKRNFTMNHGQDDKKIKSKSVKSKN